MAVTPKILAFAGSAREGSLNKKLIRIAAKAAEKAGAQVTLIDLRDYPMPIMDQDLEAQGTPENCKKFRELMINHDGFIISSPEYNSSITPLLKNSLDWASRPTTKEAYADKVALLLSASPGALGGLRSLVTVRSILENIGTIVLPEQLALVKAGEAFNEDGSLKDIKQLERIEALTKKLATVITKLRG